MNIIRCQVPELARWSPLNRLAALRDEFDRAFAATPSQDAPQTTSTTPPTNVRESEDGYVLVAEMPGVAKDGLEVTVENGELVIVGRRAAVAETGRSVYRESRGSDYRRVFKLDPSIDAGKITAKIEHGVLTLHLPKAESMKPHKIAVN